MRNGKPFRMIWELRSWLRLKLVSVAGLKLACEFGEKSILSCVSRFWNRQLEWG